MADKIIFATQEVFDQLVILDALPDGDVRPPADGLYHTFGVLDGLQSSGAVRYGAEPEAPGGETGGAFVTSATGPYFVNAASSDKASKVRYEFRGTVASLTPPSQNIGSKMSQGFDWEILNSGSYRFRAEDSTGAKLFAGGFHTTADKRVVAGQPLNEFAELDLDAGTVTYGAIGTPGTVIPFSTASTTKVFEAGRPHTLLAMHTGSQQLVGTVERVAVYVGGALATEIVGPAAEANAAPGKSGADATDPAAA